jgi:glucose-6-phosphate 1-dehydrogenase
MNILYVRFANSFLEPIWIGNYVASVQMTLVEDFGVNGRGALNGRLPARRDPEPPLPDRGPPGHGAARLPGVWGRAQRKAAVFQAMRPLKAADVVRGQYAGYRKEPDVARTSDVETFCAVRLFIDSWR